MMTEPPTEPTSAKRLDWLLTGGTSLLALALYYATLAPGVLDADSGEFQFVLWLPGLAHPTGYPLYVLLGWLWSHLIPLGEVAWRINLLSALFAAATVGLTYRLARRLFAEALPATPALGQTVAAVVTALTFAATATFWSQAIIAEVYSLHALFVVLILGLTLKLRKNFEPQRAPAKALTLAFGLSLTHHRTMVLLLPALLLFLYLQPAPRLPWRQPRLWLNHALLLIAPLLLYLYLPLIAPFTPYAHLDLSPDQPLILYENSWGGFWQHLMGSVFSGDIQPAAAGWNRLALTGQLALAQVGWPGLALALIGLISLIRPGRYDLLALTGLSGLALVSFNLIYFIGDVYVLFIPVWLIVCLWLGLGLLTVAHGLARRLTQSKAGSKDTPIFSGLARRLENNIYRLLVIGASLTGLILPLVLVTSQFSSLSQANNFIAAQRWQPIVDEPLPPEAVLVTNDRNEIMSLWYYQYVEGRRPDLLGVFPLIVPDPAFANVGRVLEQALASGRPVYLIKPMPGLGLKANLEPVGPLYRATAFTSPPGQPLDLSLPPLEVEVGRVEQVALRGYDLMPATLRAGDSFTVTLHWQAASPLTIDYTSYVHLIDSQGNGLSQHDHQPGGDFYPSRYWQPGEILRDQHPLPIPADTPPGTYQLRAGLYYQPEPGQIRGMGAGKIIGSLEIER